jgi:hypothetical protein
MYFPRITNLGLDKLYSTIEFRFIFFFLAHNYINDEISRKFGLISKAPPKVGFLFMFFITEEKEMRPFQACVSYQGLAGI